GSIYDGLFTLVRTPNAKDVIAEVSYRQPLSWYVLRFPLTTCGNDGYFWAVVKNADEKKPHHFHDTVSFEIWLPLQDLYGPAIRL
ncbi:hypothetical protein, partial [Vibrio breoganii]|uniref:hypothetical protein n=1 Tax=Vibrio breoganii TaxID=553239 RepID=UPI001A7E176D